MGAGFSPLDEELEVPDGHLLPHAHKTLVRLSSQMPFACACKELQTTLGVQVHRATARRHTLAVGMRCLQVQTQQAEPGGACPEEPRAERLSMSSDGAMVPLVGGRWAEMKLVAIGVVEQGTGKRKAEAVTRHLSYFARMTDATTFADQASAEIRRRGVERATEVCALQDGAEWITGFVDSHRHDALRILDFAHAAAYLSEIAQLIEAAGGHLPAKWLEGVLHRLKHDGPKRLLRHVSRLAVRYPQVQEQVTYLQKRTGQMDYPTYQKHGWPIGSGTVESGHRVVMQARLKGAGMHWHPAHVNPMLALRMALCNDRWDEHWADQLRLRRQQRLLRRRTRAQHRFRKLQAARHALSPQPPPPRPEPKNTGRTEAQRRWGRQTFSPRLLQQAGGAKK